MKKGLILFLILSSFACAASAYILEDFEDGLIKDDPIWFDFGNIKIEVQGNANLTSGEKSVIEKIKKGSLDVHGLTKDWYIGGIGVEKNIEAARYKAFDFDVYGYGESSGKIKVELYDDDNLDQAVVTDEKWKPIGDDLWVKEVNIDWYGWKRVSIPFSEFINQGTGNNLFDADTSKGFGPLVKVQFIFLASNKLGEIHCALDNLVFR